MSDPVIAAPRIQPPKMTQEHVSLLKLFAGLAFGDEEQRLREIQQFVAASLSPNTDTVPVPLKELEECRNALTEVMHNGKLKWLQLKFLLDAFTRWLGGHREHDMVGVGRIPVFHRRDVAVLLREVRGAVD